MKHTYIPSGVCARMIAFELDGNVIHNVSFLGGCNGNLKAVSKLVEGRTVEEVEALLRGNTCGPKPTSCADQLCIGIRKALDEDQAAAKA